MPHPLVNLAREAIRTYLETGEALDVSSGRAMGRRAACLCRSMTNLCRARSRVTCAAAAAASSL